MILRGVTRRRLTSELYVTAQVLKAQGGLLLIGLQDQRDNSNNKKS